ncbi:glycosyltransferase family 9 protein [Polynucleobacter paneuropaeus]|uniref:glycosyltransferase family 9 protein n=1 Tax=Polynucleobacter paneuropaeus TaxID=2527775 RepID=UPI001BFEE7EF|nr:glycosyltransferase family 9 protein [Polynucleobacter paneuropaeus]QWD48034.1 glycosyltransferase family 9 protein [Polynucleobacter paneuropaeus]QWD52910.1 glycosyltransferase family 9 protein [Polynucleobacter paneuropaeus]QWD57824.1 glycosyltransferase family 9 protein [Polynucleobacter paneuropaeus]
MKSILVLRYAALGDFIMAVPALTKIRSSFSGHKIILLTTHTSEKSIQKLVSSYVGGASYVPWVDLVMPNLIDQVEVIKDVFNIRQLWSLRTKFSNIDFDAGILLLDPCSPWVGRIKKLILLRFLLGMAPIYGWRSKGSINGDVSLLKLSGSLRHHVHGPLQFLSELPEPQTYKDDELRFDLRPSCDSERWASSWMAKGNIQDKRLVAIAPGSLQPHKQWPIESYSQLIEALLISYDDIYLVILGAPKDKAIGEAMVTLNPDRISNLAGVTTIDQSAAFLRYVTLLIGNDGGAMHLGDAMGCKVISLVPGIEYPDSVEPWHNKDLAIRWPVDCAPCYSFTNCPQGHQKCMREIPVAVVLAKCKTVL